MIPKYVKELEEMKIRMEKAERFSKAVPIFSTFILEKKLKMLELNSQPY